MPSWECIRMCLLVLPKNCRSLQLYMIWKLMEWFTASPHACFCEYRKLSLLRASARNHCLLASGVLLDGWPFLSMPFPKLIRDVPSRVGARAPGRGRGAALGVPGAEGGLGDHHGADGHPQALDWRGGKRAIYVC